MPIARETTTSTSPTRPLRASRRKNRRRGNRGSWRCSYMAEGRHQGSGVGGLHQGLTDEHGVRAGGTDARGVGRRKDAALGHGDDFGRKLRNEPLAQAEIGLKDG